MTGPVLSSHCAEVYSLGDGTVFDPMETLCVPCVDREQLARAERTYNAVGAHFRLCSRMRAELRARRHEASMMMYDVGTGMFVHG